MREYQKDNLGNDHYGYTPFGEIQFAAVGPRGERALVTIWGLHFNVLVERIQPVNGSWVGLALPFHLACGWYDQSPWVIENLTLVVQQWRDIDLGSEVPYVCTSHAMVLELLEQAVLEEATVAISYS
jgi:hypothetical protein